MELFVVLLVDALSLWYLIATLAVVQAALPLGAFGT